MNIWLTNLTLIDTLRVMHPTTEEYLLFLSAHRTITKIDHILSHSLQIFKDLSYIPDHSKTKKPITKI